MKTFSIRQAYLRGWNLFVNNKKLAILSTLIILIVSSVQRSKTQTGGSFVVWIIILALNLLVQIGWLKIMLAIEEGSHTKLRELFTHTELFWKYAAVYIIFLILVSVGFIALIVPGIYFLLTYQFALIISIDRKVGIKEAFTESARLTSGTKWKLLLMLALMAAVNIVGALAFIVGLLITVPVSMLALVHIYKELSKEA